MPQTPASIRQVCLAYFFGSVRKGKVAHSHPSNSQSQHRRWEAPFLHRNEHRHSANFSDLAQMLAGCCREEHSLVTQSWHMRAKNKRTGMLPKTKGPTNAPDKPLSWWTSPQGKEVLEMKRAQTDLSIATKQLLRFSLTWVVPLATSQGFPCASALVQGPALCSAAPTAASNTGSFV